MSGFGDSREPEPERASCEQLGDVSLFVRGSGRKEHATTLPVVQQAARQPVERQRHPEGRSQSCSSRRRRKTNSRPLLRTRSRRGCLCQTKRSSIANYLQLRTLNSKTAKDGGACHQQLKEQNERTRRCRKSSVRLNLKNLRHIETRVERGKRRAYFPG